MRIIGGIYKGKKILLPKDLSTRPLKDLTKESIFNIIEHSNKFSINLNNSDVLDLFSGTGSFGIECLSRGAKHVFFVEYYKEILPILKKNLIKLKLSDSYKIVEDNIFSNLNFNTFKKKFDIIFLDPPYKENDLTKLIQTLVNEKFLKNNGILIIHRHQNHKDVFTKNIKIIEEKKYGISKIIFGIIV
tara:strand:- start:1716 stop:2279 length:564 start_codon:yes stop_codon:yes gene_type:complete